MELVLKGFEDWSIDTAHNENGKRWVEIWNKEGNDWFQHSTHDTIDDAMEELIYNGLNMTEDEICQVQESCH